MASSNSIPPPARASDSSAAMRDIATDIRETIARSRELIQQAQEAIAPANLITEVQADYNPERTP